MKSSIDELVSVIDRLLARLDDLENRVSALEHPAAAHLPALDQPAILPRQHPLSGVSTLPGNMAVLGKVFLGIAGAYVLRALAEAGTLPLWAVVTVSLIYAGSWLVWSARTHPQSGFAAAAYAAAAGMILSPMLWELTLSFRILSSSLSAAVLAGFAIAALALGWKSRRAAIVAPPLVFASVTAVALLPATRDPIPFFAALLLLVAATELAAAGDRWPGLRAVPALLCDLTALALLFIYTGRAPSPEYAFVSTTGLVVLFSALSILPAAFLVVRAAIQGTQAGAFEIAQTSATFVLATLGVLRATHGKAAAAVGAFCLVLAGICYLLSFARFQHANSLRNFCVFSTWAALLLVSGSVFFFPGEGIFLLPAIAAMTIAWIGSRSQRPILAFHGAFYMLAAAATSGLLFHASGLLMGALPHRAGFPVWTAGVFAVVIYALAWVARKPGIEEIAMPQWPWRTVYFIFAALAACALIAAVLAALLAVTGMNSPARIASLRTLVLCATAVASGWTGARFRRPELTWLAYGLIAFTTIKFLFEDLLAGQPATIAISLAAYAMFWLLVPRFRRDNGPPR